jgi:hypothetical protein
VRGEVRVRVRRERLELGLPRVGLAADGRGGVLELRDPRLERATLPDVVALLAPEARDDVRELLPQQVERSRSASP